MNPQPVEAVWQCPACGELHGDFPEYETVLRVPNGAIFRESEWTWDAEAEVYRVLGGQYDDDCEELEWVDAPCGALVDPEDGEPCSPGSGNGIFSSGPGWKCGECGTVYEDWPDGRAAAEACCQEPDDDEDLDEDGDEDDDQ